MSAGLDRGIPFQAAPRSGPLPPSRHLGYVSYHRNMMMGRPMLRRLCPACARKQRAQHLAGTHKLKGEFCRRIVALLRYTAKTLYGRPG
jgi:hypothetical protein